MSVTVKNHSRRLTAKAHGNGARAENGNAAPKFKTVPRKARAKKMVTEMWGGEPYEFYPLGKYVVADPDICSGEPTFKYTRIQAFYALDLIAGGWTVKRIADEWWGGKVSVEAIQEALHLSAIAWLENLSARVNAQ